MSTELLTQDQTPLAEQQVVLEEEHGSDDLLRFARDLQIAYNFSRSLVTTPFVPQQYQGNPGNAAAAIMAARGVGIADPMTALRSLDIIQGTPAFRANTLRALALADGHEIWVVEANSQRVVMHGRRKGSDHVQEVLWDMDRARAMQLVSKDNWKKQPQAMLIARATSELVRLIAADRLAGIYSIEELSDGVEAATPATSTESKTPVKRTMRRRKVEPKPAEEAPTVAAPVPVEEESAVVQEPQAPEAAPVEPEPANEPFTGDPGQPTSEELAEWNLLPEGFNA